MTINILGTEYKIIFSNEKETPTLANKFGYCDKTSKEIVIIDNFGGDSIDDVKNVSIVKHEIMRHEILHAFFCESGLEFYSNDETLVHFLATQFPKIYDIFEGLSICDGEPIIFKDTNPESEYSMGETKEYVEYAGSTEFSHPLLELGEEATKELTEEIREEFERIKKAEELGLGKEYLKKSRDEYIKKRGYERG